MRRVRAALSCRTTQSLTGPEGAQRLSAIPGRREVLTSVLPVRLLIDPAIMQMRLAGCRHAAVCLLRLLFLVNYCHRTPVGDLYRG